MSYMPPSHPPKHKNVIYHITPPAPPPKTAEENVSSRAGNMRCDPENVSLGCHEKEEKKNMRCDQPPTPPATLHLQPSDPENVENGRDGLGAVQWSVTVKY